MYNFRYYLSQYRNGPKRRPVPHFDYFLRKTVGRAKHDFTLAKVEIGNISTLFQNHRQNNLTCILCLRHDRVHFSGHKFKPVNRTIVRNRRNFVNCTSNFAPIFTYYLRRHQTLSSLGQL